MIVRGSNITKSYEMAKGTLSVLNGINLEIDSGQFITIVGPSGAGKSTLLHILGALDKPTAGEIWLNGIKVSELNDKEMAKLRNQTVGFVFQFHHLLPEFTAFENVLIPALIAGKDDEASRERAKKLLQQVGLGERFSHRPNELSGGEQQRAAVARALMNEPKIILADEPSGNLDRTNSEKLHELMINLCRENGQTFVIVTHNEHLAERSDRVIRLTDGRIESDSILKG